jgi:hypothetical protein
MAKLILPDVTIVQTINAWWPEPYQTEVMGTICLCESGGDVFAHAPVTDPLSVLYKWDDRGLLGINEGAINEVRGSRIDPRTCYDPLINVEYGRDIWDWRFDRAISPRSHGGLGLGYSAALVYAYEGWTTYKNRGTNLVLAHAWSVFRPRIKAAIREAGIA